MADIMLNGAFMGTVGQREGEGIGIITRMGVMKNGEITALRIGRQGWLERAGPVVRPSGSWQLFSNG